MRVFRATYTDRKGRQRESSKWYVEFPDHRDQPRRIAGFTDRKATEELGRKIEKLVGYRVNRESPDRELARWIEDLPASIRKRLVAVDVIDGQTAAGNKPLVEHVDDFYNALVAKGTSKKQATQQRQRVLAVFSGCGFRFWGDVQPAPIMQYLAERRAKSRKGLPRLSCSTSNSYLGAVQHFGNWMVENSRAMRSPVEHLGKLDVVDEEERRALSVDELRRLLEAARSSGSQFGTPGPERAASRGRVSISEPRCRRLPSRREAASAGRTTN
jgi:hypothetical protein